MKSNSIKDFEKKNFLKILILGPQKSEADLYKKRSTLKDKIIELGHDVKFFEDYMSKEYLARSGLNLSTKEYQEAILDYEYIICLMDSPGTIGEVHDFGRSPTIASKMTICIDKKNNDGYSAHFLRIFEGNHGRIDWYESKDILECNLSTRIIDQIMKVYEAKIDQIIRSTLT